MEALVEIDANLGRLRFLQLGDFETLDFRIERSRGQPEFRGAAGWARDLSITFL
jgi:hypothetical protein